MIYLFKFCLVFNLWKKIKIEKWELYWSKINLFTYLETRKWVIYKKSEKLLQLLFFLIYLLFLEECPVLHTFIATSTFHKTTIKCTLLQCHHWQPASLSCQSAPEKPVKNCSLPPASPCPAACFSSGTSTPGQGSTQLFGDPTKLHQATWICTLLTVQIVLNMRQGNEAFK